MEDWLKEIDKANPCLAVIERHCIQQEPNDPPLLTLCRAATHALIAEDSALAAAFAAGRTSYCWPAPTEEPLGNGHVPVGSYSRGLSYWLYETTIVYTLFKAWLPLVPAVWECSQSTLESHVGSSEGPKGTRKNRKRKVYDMVVLTPPGAEWKPLVFEAKWWASEDHTDGISMDVDKLYELGCDYGRYLLLFWFSWNRETHWSADLKAVSNPKLEGKKWKSKPKPVYFATFPADCRANTWQGEGETEQHKQTSSGYFAMTVLKVT